MTILSLGILAHVDAGKTSLTERILYTTGSIQTVGSVDKGTTQTDTMEIERARGITIRSAVAAFSLGDLTVNLIDTPGHADFVAEVERSLRVLDGVVLVVSAVQGVQNQTRRLAQAVRAAGLPTIIFVNKIDSLGARSEALLPEIARTLKMRVVSMNSPQDLGTRAASVSSERWDDAVWRDALTDHLAELDEEIIAEFERSGGELSSAFLRAALRRQTGEIVPVYFGSAITGAGVPELLDGVAAWLTPADLPPDAPTLGTVFKIARRPSGEKLVYARLLAGELVTRQKVLVQRRNALREVETTEERVTGIARFVSAAQTRAASASAGEIVVLSGLRAARIGDTFGEGDLAARELPVAFAPPALESNVQPCHPGQLADMRNALEALAEQDPLISLRQHNDEGEVSVRLYGEVQKEVLAETLLRDYGVAVRFGLTRTVCIERPLGVGEAAEIIFTPENPFYATVGFRIEPGEVGSGVQYERELGSLPLAFYRAIEETIHDTLTQGLHGWGVTDCRVTLTQAGFSSVLSTAGDFRKATPLALMQALHAAGTETCEPIELLELEIPEDTFGPVCGALVNAHGVIRNAYQEESAYRIFCAIPTAELRGIEQHLPGLTRGEAGWVTSFAGYVPVAGVAPSRARIGPNPLNRAHYLAEVARG